MLKYLVQHMGINYDVLSDDSGTYLYIPDTAHLSASEERDLMRAARMHLVSRRLRGHKVASTEVQIVRTLPPVVETDDELKDRIAVAQSLGISPDYSAGLDDAAPDNDNADYSAGLDSE